MVKKKGSVLSTPSTAGHQTPTIHTGRSIYHMTKLSHKHFVLGCTSSDAMNLPLIAEASVALRGNTAVEKMKSITMYICHRNLVKMLIMMCKSNRTAYFIS